jgi:GAF domain-containing protein
VTQPDRERAVGRAFVELADTLVDDYDIIDLLDRLVAHSVRLLAADAAGLLLADSNHELRVVAASSEAVQLMELLQVQTAEGPCVDCYRTGRPVSAPDLQAVAARWPDFAKALEGGPFRSVHALPLRLRGTAIGTLNLFHSVVGSLPEADLALGQALADVATIGILQERAIRHGEVLSGQLQTALNNRVVIEQAKGVIAQSLDLDMGSAFDRLRTYCRSNNLRLADIAARIVTREIDPRERLLTTGPPAARQDRRSPGRP